MEVISIIIPVYNAEKYLKECIESVINQTYKNLEIILIDDGSSDKCMEICHAYEKIDNRIKVIKKENGGTSSARNLGLEIATGDFIMFLDADDTFEQNACELLYNEIKNKNADLITGNYRYMDFDGKPWSKVVFDTDKYKNFKLSINDYNNSFYVMNSAVWNKIFRKTFIDKLGLKFVNGVPAEDAIFITYCFLHSQNVYYISDIICNYRQRNDKSSVSNNCTKKYFDGINKAYKMIYNNFNDMGQLAYYRYFYAKSMSYILYKFIDSEVMTDSEKIEVMKNMDWFYALSQLIEVKVYQKSLEMIIQEILNHNYELVLNYCNILREMRNYIDKEVKEKMSKPDLEMYKDISMLDKKYERKNLKFYCEFSCMYDNNIFSNYDLKPVVEDAYNVKENIFCIADGITRDSIEGQAIPYPSSKEEAIQVLKVYPNPSGAYEAAKICADKFIEYISNYSQDEINEQLIYDIVKKINLDIQKINEGRYIDYLKDDLYGCVAVGGIIINNMLYCFSIGDCRIEVFNKSGNTIFKTINNHKQFEDYLENVYKKENKFDWQNPEDRVLVRRDFRNKPDKKYKGNDISFGALTGEKEAENYIDVYSVNLDEAEYICAFSDGYQPYFDNQKNILETLRHPEITKNEGKERTLVLYKKIGE